MTGSALRRPAARGTHLIYLAAGLVSWPIAAVAIYWGLRFANSLASVAPGSPAGGSPPPGGIGFGAALLYALPVAALILFSGWVQRSRV